MENEDPEVIRRRMLEKRTDLTEKVEALEQQVRGVASSVTETVESVKEGVQETVEAVKGQVEETVGAVKDTVQDTVGAVKDTVQETVETAKGLFNVRRHVENYPWAMLGGSVGVGVLLGMLLRRRTMARVGEAAETVTRRFRGPAPQPQPPAREDVYGGDGARREPGLADNLLGPVKEGLTRVKDMALGALVGTLRELLVKELPQAAETQVKAFLDETLTKLKEAAKPKPAAETYEREEGPRGAARRETAFHPETGRPMSPGSW